MMLMDDVVCPAHYRFESFDAIDVVEAVARTIPRGDDAANTGNILKYMMRWTRKDGLKDLYKARQYLDRLIRIVESRTGGAPAEASQHPMMAEAIRDGDAHRAAKTLWRWADEPPSEAVDSLDKLRKRATLDVRDDGVVVKNGTLDVWPSETNTTAGNRADGH